MSDSYARTTISSASADDDWLVPPCDDPDAGFDRRVRAPLLAPALALIAGVAASELGASIGVLVSLAAALALLAAIPPLGLTFRSAWQSAARQRAVLALILAVVFLIGICRHRMAIELPRDHIALRADAEPILVRIVGEVVTQPIVSSPARHNPFLPTDPAQRTRFVLASEAITADGRLAPCSGLVQASIDGRKGGLSPGTRIELTGRLYAPRGPRNPGEIDWRGWHRLNGIRAVIASDSPDLVTSIGQGSVWRQTVAGLRSFVRAGLIEPGAQADDDDSIALLDAMVLGQRSVASQRINEAFRRTGAIHYLSVSGFHVGLLAMLSWWVTQRLLRRGPHMAAIVTALLVLAYVLIAEPNSPILRAAMMSWLACLAVLIGRPLSPFNWLALSAIVILLMNPLQLFQAGFQYSFIQVGLILLMSAWLARMGRKPSGDARSYDAHSWPEFVGRGLAHFIRTAAIICFACWLISIPLSLFHYGMFTPYGAIQSLLLTLPATLLTGATFGCLIVGLLVPPSRDAVSQFATWLADAFLWGVDILAVWPGSLQETSSPPAWLVVLTYFAVGLGLYLWLRPEETRLRWLHKTESRLSLRRRRHAAVAIAVTLAGGWLTWLFIPAGLPRYTAALDVLDVGNGSCALLSVTQSGATVFDCGTLRNRDVGRTVADACRKRGVARLNSLFLSHANIDHYSGLGSLLEALPCPQVISHAGFASGRPAQPAVRAALDRLARHRLAMTPWHAGRSHTIGECVIECLWPPADPPEAWDENDRSLVLRLSIGSTRILVPGDAAGLALWKLAQAHRAGEVDLRADILIAPHHGATIDGVTEPFLHAVSPRAILVSAAQPRARFEAAVARVLGPGRPVMTTGVTGAIRVTIDRSGRWSLETPFATDN